MTSAGILRRRWSLRSTRAAGASLLLAFVLLCPGTTPARAAAERFSGYQGITGGTAISLIPSVPSLTVVAAPLQGNLALAYATLHTGGQGFARASTFYPGELVAGLGPLLGQVGLPVALPDYPVEANSREVDGERTNDPAPGIHMQAKGGAEESTAVSEVKAAGVPIALSVGSARTTSIATITSDTLKTTTVASASDIGLASGLVKIRSVQSTATALTDATRGGTSGGLEISGLEIGGMPATVDQNGVHVGPSSTPLGNPSAQVASLLSGAGVTMRVLESSSGPPGANATRTTGGLLVELPLPAAGPLPPGGRLAIIIGQTTASVLASPALDYTGEVPPPSPENPALIIGSAARLPGPALSSGNLAPIDQTPATNPGQSLPRPARAASDPVATGFEAPQAVAYSFGGVPIPGALFLLLLCIPGIRRVRRYVERLFELSA